jgi:YHS domain-containing protein
LAKDPVCDVTVDEKTARFTATHDGRTFYSCSSQCESTFDKDPHKYAH